MGNRLVTHLHLDIPSHLLVYSNKDQNPIAGIELKTCFLLHYKIKTYRVPKYVLIYKHDYVAFSFFSITVYFEPLNYSERVINSIFTIKAETCEKWEMSLEDYFKALRFKSIPSNLSKNLKRKEKCSVCKNYEIIKCLYKNQVNVY